MDGGTALRYVSAYTGQHNTTQKETDVIRKHDIRDRKYTSVCITHLKATFAFQHISLQFVSQSQAEYGDTFKDMTYLKIHFSAHNEQTNQITNLLNSMEQIPS